MTLPIDAIFDQLNHSLLTQPRLILQAAPGAGKSTRLPLLLLASGGNAKGPFSTENQIVILEPRRVAARQIATYLASQLNEKVGDTVGLVMRGENKFSNKTKLNVITDGVLVKWLQNDPELTNIGLVIFDEFHERAIQSDLALALTLDSQALNESLSVLIMSATIDTELLSEKLNAPVISAAGRQFPVDIKYVKSELIPTVQDIIQAIQCALRESDSSILVFLSGVAEIKRVAAQLSSFLSAQHSSSSSTQSSYVDNNVGIYPLYGGLPIEQQVKAIKPLGQNSDIKRKVVLSTNIAQTSLTIEDVDVVVDAGQEKINVYQAKLNTDMLLTQGISKAAAVQRAGRAGRLRPGKCYRLGDIEHWNRRPAFDVAEIERSDLSQLLLEVDAWGADFNDLFWASKPDKNLFAVSRARLKALGYSDSPALVKRYQQMGADPRMTRMLDFAAVNEPKLIDTAAWLAAWIEMGLNDNSINVPTRLNDLQHSFSTSSRRNPSLQLEQRFNKYLGLLKVESSAASHQASPHNTTAKYTASFQIEPDYIGLLLAVAFPDRIAKNKQKRWKMSNGGAVEFHQNTEQLSHSELIVVIDFNASKYGHYIQHYAEVELTDLEEYLPELLITKNVVTWSDTKKAPIAQKQTQIDQLVLSSNVVKIELSDQDWQDLWLDYVEKHGLESFGKNQLIIHTWLAKMDFVYRNTSKGSWPLITASDLLTNTTEWLAPHLSQIRNVAQLQKLDLLTLLNNLLEWPQQQQLKKWCPSHYETPAKTKVRIEYLTQNGLSAPTPKISVRLQEMFGEPKSPTICNDQQPLLIELLSPAQRPLQVTQDLAHFWKNAYVDVKKEMKGRYPKHRWPDSPEDEKAGHSLKRKHEQ